MPAARASFQVLELLAQLLDLAFQLHHQAGDVHVLAFGADGIGLAVSSWVKKSSLRPTGPSPERMSRYWAIWLCRRTVSSSMAVLSAKMAASVTRRDSSMLRSASSSLQAGVELVRVRLDPAGGVCLDPAHQLLHHVQVGEQVGLEFFALGGAHGQESGPRPAPPPPVHPPTGPPHPAARRSGPARRAYGRSGRRSCRFSAPAVRTAPSWRRGSLWPAAS